MKGNKTNQINSIKFGKYRFLKVLGQGQSGTVYLAKHLNLDAMRAIKEIPRNQASSQWILQEAQLLKSLHHPGIPIIYDIEEDIDSYYLIEEYIEGESFSELFLHQSFLSTELFYQYFLQLCDIFSYLESAVTGPVFYLDLKPAHVLLSADHLKLIDFGVYCCDRGEEKSVFGNLEYTAPEVLDGNLPTPPAAVYSLGKFMAYLGEHMKFSDFQPMIPIFQKSVSPNPAHRYETVDALAFAVKQTLQQNSESTSCKKIAVIGSFHGCGSTHIGISMTCALNFSGRPSIYLEKNSSDSLRAMAGHSKFLRNEKGLLFYRNFIGLPLYGPGIEIQVPDSEILLSDYGSEYTLSDLSSSDLIVLVANACLWQLDRVISIKDSLLPYRDRLIILCNSSEKKDARKLSAILKLPVTSYPTDSHPFAVTKEKQLFFNKLLK